MKNKETLINTVSSILLQIITIISGFIVPRLLLDTFGSEVNGLVTSLTQFLKYMDLFEGGLSSVILASLYKPMRERNYDKISSIVVMTNKFYKKLSLLFIGYTVILAVIYPIVVKSQFSFTYISSLTLILSINLFCQYCFSITWRTLLRADKKVYYVSIVQILVIVLNTVAVVIGIYVFPNIHVIKFVTSVIYILQPILFEVYVRKHYKIDKRVEPDADALKQRWDGFGINIAAFVHNNTDLVVLSLFSNLKNASIYSVYFLVTSGLKSIITSISAGIQPTLGHVYVSGDKEKLNNTFNAYEFIIYCTSCFLFIVGGLCITPFVQLYTNGITDANYFQPVLGWLMILSELVFCIREPYVNMAYCANKFKQVSKYAYMEAVLNIVLSIVLVIKFGIVGVAIGTLVSMTYRTFSHMYFLRKNILNRSLKIVLKNIVFFGIASIIIILVSMCLFKIEEINIFTWIVFAIKNAALSIFVYGMVVVLFYKDSIKDLKTMFKK